MIQADGTKDKSNLGANAIPGCLHRKREAAANANGDASLPLPGRSKRKPSAAAADDEHLKWRRSVRANTVDVQEFMIMPAGAPSFKEGQRRRTEGVPCSGSSVKVQRTGYLRR